MTLARVIPVRAGEHGDLVTQLIQFDELSAMTGSTSTGPIEVDILR